MIQYANEGMRPSQGIQGEHKDTLEMNASPGGDCKGGMEYGKPFFVDLIALYFKKFEGGWGYWNSYFVNVGLPFDWIWLN